MNQTKPICCTKFDVAGRQRCGAVFSFMFSCKVCIECHRCMLWLKHLLNKFLLAESDTDWKLRHLLSATLRTRVQYIYIYIYTSQIATRVYNMTNSPTTRRQEPPHTQCKLHAMERVIYGWVICNTISFRQPCQQNNIWLMVACD